VVRSGIRAATLEKFAATFAPMWIPPASPFSPCYGLAEATLIVSGGPRRQLPTVIQLQADAVDAKSSSGGGGRRCQLAQSGRLRREPAESTGRDCESTDRLPLSQRRNRRDLGPKGPASRGAILNSPKQPRPCSARSWTRRQARVRFCGPATWGFLRAGQLFVTGRLKDLIIIRGRNYYPEDIEHSVDGCPSGTYVPGTLRPSRSTWKIESG